MPKLVVPTRNRPFHIEGFLAFLARFYPETEVIVADGSDAGVQPRIHEICAAAAGRLNVEFRPYPADLLLFDRLLDVLDGLRDEVVLLAADDDYPLMDAFDRAADVLASDPRLSAVVPYDIVLQLNAGRGLAARLSVSRPIAGATAAERVASYARWPVATSYGAVRRSAMTARYRMLADCYCAGFIDFQIGVEDAVEGEIATTGELGCIRTHSYNGSYSRHSDKLVFLRRSDTVLRIAEHIARRIAGADSITEEAAAATATEAVVQQISLLTGGSLTDRLGFAESDIFLDPAVQDQYAAFYDIFRNGTASRGRYAERLHWVRDRLFEIDRREPQNTRGHYEVF